MIDVVLNDDHDLIPMIKWLVAFRNRNPHGSTGIISIREFLCGGFYEAFERVQGYTEKTNVEVLWFKEKRTCDEPLINSDLLPLGYFCTFCNIEYNPEDSIPCEDLHCNSILCSRRCYKQHVELKHTSSNTLRRPTFKFG
jgi:hypothetical protein